MISEIVSIFGASIVLYRASQWTKRSMPVPLLSEVEMRSIKVSVIVPARNEERNLPPLLESLMRSGYPNLEIIVVDDQSEDRTKIVASSFAVTILDGRERPAGWGGKQWACHQGAMAATGEILLFTDADTRHMTDGISKAVSCFRTNQLDMMSVLPFHTARDRWEKLTGFFQILLLFAANAFGKQRAGRAYCIGQYIMFSTSAYQSLGGHSAVKERLVEDVPLANLAIKMGLNYQVLPMLVAYSVRMYATPREFIRGWRRNFAAGLKDSSVCATVEVSMVLGSMIFGGNLAPGIIELICFGIAVFVGYKMSARYTNYGLLWSVLGLPVSICLFCLISGLSLIDVLFSRELIWKGRVIRASA